MRIVVTGAAGRVGSVIARHLSAQGHTVIGIDLRTDAAVLPEVRAHDLLDATATAGLFAEARPDALIHLANHPSSYSAPQGIVYRENVAMTWNAFESAVAAGTRRIVYASSIQAMSGGPRDGGHYQNRVPVFPLPADGTEPPNPGNAYGLSKAAGEDALALWCHRDGVSGVSLRLPMVLDAETQPPAWIFSRDWSDPQPEFCAYLPANAAATLVEAILSADLPGHRVYTPSCPLPPNAPSMATLLAGPYAGVTLRRPAASIAQPFDTSGITADTGWIPPLHPVSVPA